MVAVFPLIGEPLVQSRRQMLSATTLCLPQSLCCLAQFVRMSNFLATGEGEQVMKAWINAYRSITSMRNRLGLSLDEQAQIPPRSTANDTTALDTSSWDALGMKPDMPYAWDVDTCALWSCERIRKRDAGELVALAFQPRLLRQALEAPLPGRISVIQHTLQRMARHPKLFAMISKQIVKRFSGVIDAIVSILFDLAYSPIPDTRQLEQPGVELRFLRGIEPKFELPLDHLTPVSGSRCIV